jgi:2-polyprenyl-6-methoxyphenol hydroxylase-like FAD-dependent oxidoreductase
MSTRTVLISGAGIAGPTLAWWLRRKGFTPTIVEGAPAPRTGGYIMDFWGVGYDVAERMELIPTLRRIGYHLEELRIVDTHGKRVAGLHTNEFDAATNGRYLSILRGDLASAIFDRITQRGGERDSMRSADAVETIFGDSITHLDQDDDGVSVAFEHTPPRRFDLVVGADGLHSNTRRLAFGAAPDGENYEKYLGYYTAAFSTSHYPHRDEGVYVSYAVPGRQVARYALRDDRAAFFLILAAEEPLAVDHRDAGQQRRILHDAFDGTGWEVDEIMRAMDSADDLYFDSVAQARLPHWSRGRIALVGDAAYCPSLIAGQGSAFAMAGAFVLAHELAAAAGDHRVAFEAYERRFKPFIDDKQRSAEKFGGWFAPRTPFKLALRNLATHVMSIPLLGEWMIDRSLSDRFELPDA